MTWDEARMATRDAWDRIDRSRAAQCMHTTPPK
jgi:hypothetical protein